MTAADVQEFVMRTSRAFVILGIIFLVVIRLAYPHKDGKE